MNKYKVGDSVVIKPWALMEQQYGLDEQGYIDTGGKNRDKCPFMPSMEDALEGTDRVMEITGGVGDRYCSTIFKGFTICDQMILGYAFTYGQLIEVSGDGVTWTSGCFLAYVPGDPKIVRYLEGEEIYDIGPCDVHYQRFARPATATVYNLALTCNGEKVPLSTLSEGSILNMHRWVGGH